MTGLILGTAGSFMDGVVDFGMSLFIQGVIKLVAGALIVIMGVNMLGLFPSLRKLNLHMPNFTNSSSYAGPMVTGLLNGLMPCGPLQSVQMIAFASGSPVSGTLVMLSFGMGTLPLMSSLGVSVSLLGKRFTRSISYAGAVVITVMGLAMFSQGSALSGFLQFDRIINTSASESSASYIDGDVQVVNSVLASGRYPAITVKQGIPVKWNIGADGRSINGCNYKMIIDDLGIEHTFAEGRNVIEFTPENKGDIQYYCWMGMIRGSILVTD